MIKGVLFQKCYAGRFHLAALLEQFGKGVSAEPATLIIEKGSHWHPVNQPLSASTDLTSPVLIQYFARAQAVRTFPFEVET